MRTTREALAISEATRALDEQRAAIDTLQSRAGVLLAVGALGNVGLGPLVFGGHVGVRWPWLTVPGIAAGVAAYLMALVIAWPRALAFHLPALPLLNAEEPFDSSDEEIVGHVIRGMEITRARNEKVLTKSTRLLRGTVLALGVNATAWFIVGVFGR